MCTYFEDSKEQPQEQFTRFCALFDVARGEYVTNLERKLQSKSTPTKQASLNLLQRYQTRSPRPMRIRP